MSNRYLRSSTMGAAISMAVKAAADGSLGKTAGSASLVGFSATPETPHALRRWPAPRAQSEDFAREDSQQPAENCGREDDPDQRSIAGADHPTQLHLPGIREDEGNQDDEQRDEAHRPGVEAGATAVSSQTVAAFLGSGVCGHRSGLVRFDLHLRSSLVDIEVDRALQSTDGSGLFLEGGSLRGRNASGPAVVNDAGC
jgi:hypothetical protein